MKKRKKNKIKENPRISRITCGSQSKTRQHQIQGKQSYMLVYRQVTTYKNKWHFGLSSLKESFYSESAILNKYKLQEQLEQRGYYRWGSFDRAPKRWSCALGDPENHEIIQESSRDGRERVPRSFSILNTIPFVDCLLPASIALPR